MFEHLKNSFLITNTLQLANFQNYFTIKISFDFKINQNFTVEN